MEPVESVDKRFMESLVKPYLRLRRTNLEAYVLFDAIQRAFDVHNPQTSITEYRWMTDVDMVAMLAACAESLMEENARAEEVDWKRRGNALMMALRGFMRTLSIAIRRGATHEHEGQTCFRSFVIPAWFVEWAKERKLEYEGPEFFPAKRDYLDPTYQSEPHLRAGLIGT